MRSIKIRSTAFTEVQIELFLTPAAVKWLPAVGKTLAWKFVWRFHTLEVRQNYFNEFIIT